MNDEKGASLLETKPVTVAGAFLIAVQSIMAAIWAVLGDIGAIPNITIATQALITAAVMAVATLGTMVVVDKHTTSVATPTLPANTRVTVTNGDNKPAAVQTLTVE